MSTVLTDSGSYMSKRRDVRSDPVRSILRDLSNVVLPRIDPLADLRALNDARRVVTDIADRRRFHPMGPLRPAGGLTRNSTRLKIAPAQKRGKLPSRISFNIPKHVAVCVRRKIRKEVIFASGKGGKGGRKAPYRRNYWSDVRC